MSEITAETWSPDPMLYWHWTDTQEDVVAAPLTISRVGSVVALEIGRTDSFSSPTEFQYLECELVGLPSTMVPSLLDGERWEALGIMRVAYTEDQTMEDGTTTWVSAIMRRSGDSYFLNIESSTAFAPYLVRLEHCTRCYIVGAETMPAPEIPETLSNGHFMGPSHKNGSNNGNTETITDM